MEKVLILTSDSNTGYPVPATKGGAVSELVENIIDSNEKNPVFNFELVSIYEEKAEKKAKKYNYTKFHWCTPRTIVNSLDKVIFKIAKLLLKERSKSFKSMLALIQYILFAGRISWEKGIDKLIDAVKKINSNNIKILIVGSTLHGENKVRKTKYIKKLEDKIHDLNSKIIFTGYISYEIMPVVYNLADIAVLPSMWEEPAGLTPLEAMACGTPVITTDSGGIPEYVGKSAVVLKRNTNLVSDIARNITNLLNDKELYELYRSEGLSRVQLYNSNNYAEELRKIL